MTNCILCDSTIEDSHGEPYLIFKDNVICQQCYIDLVPAIYKMAGHGDGGLVHIIFKESLQSNNNRKHRTQIRGYREILKELLTKYKFSCVLCTSKNDLTIDHIKPVSKGGSDEINNLQIMCRSCNSKKGATWIE